MLQLAVTVPNILISLTHELPKVTSPSKSTSPPELNPSDAYILDPVIYPLALILQLAVTLPLRRILSAHVVPKLVLPSDQRPNSCGPEWDI